MSGLVGTKLNIRGSGPIDKLGTDGQVLTSAGAGLKPAFETVAAGGGDWVALVTDTVDASSTGLDYNGFSSTYDNYKIILNRIGNSSNDMSLYFRYNVASSALTANYFYQNNKMTNGTAGADYSASTTYFYLYYQDTQSSYTDYKHFLDWTIFDVNSTTAYKFSEWNSHSNDDNTYTMRRGIGFNHTNTSALSGFKIYPSANNVTFDYWIFGMKPA